MHDTITIGIPVFAILLGILLNQRGLDKVEAGIDKLDSKTEGRLTHLESRIDRIQADLTQFYRILGEHSARLHNLEKRS